MSYRKPLTLREIQDAVLNTFKGFISLCELLGVRYYINYGTLIGAIRHKGFIPWDDDIDVMMLRNDYERFISYCANNREDIRPYEVIHYSTNANYYIPIARFSNTDYEVEIEGEHNYGLGLFIDIYPIDHCGDTIEEAREYLHKNEFYLKMAALASMDRFSISQQGVWRTPVKALMFLLSRIGGRQYFARLLDRRAKEESDRKGDKYIACVIWELCDNLIERKEEFDDSIQVEFESIMCSAPVGYDTVLKRFYGDYMVLPPEDERIPNHHYQAFRKLEK